MGVHGIGIYYILRQLRHCSYETTLTNKDTQTVMIRYFTDIKLMESVFMFLYT